jgi:hypothetical protein
MEKSIPFLLTHFESWLTMNYFILLEKIVFRLAGYHQAVLSLIPLIAGIATIPLTALLARQFTSTKTALLSATLVVANSYLIYYSGIIRSYSLLTAFSLLVVILFFKWSLNRNYKNGIYLALACYLLILSHPNGVYTIGYILLILGLDVLDTLRRKEKPSTLTFLLPFLGSVLLMIVSYLRIIPPFLEWGTPWHDTPPTSIDYLPYVFSEYFASGYFGWLSAILLISGILSTVRSLKPLLILLPSLVLPIILISVQGISHYPWAYSRFLIFMLPICILFIAEGIQSLSSLTGTHLKNLSLALTVILLITWIPNLLSSYHTKIDFPWNQAASFIKQTSNVNIILYGEAIEKINFYPYFSKTEYRQSELSAFKKGNFIPATGKNVYFVTTGPSIFSNYQKYTFGKIQVIIYPTNTYENQLQMIRTDLLKSENIGKVSSDLTDVYRNIWQLSRKLDGDNMTSFSYYDLFMHCLQLTAEQRSIPLSLQYAQLQANGYQVIKDH